MGWLDNPGQLLSNQENRIRNTFSDTSGVTGWSGLTHPTRNAHMLIQNTDPGYRMLNPSGGNQTKAQRLYDQGLVSSGQAFVGNWAGGNIYDYLKSLGGASSGTQAGAGGGMSGMSSMGGMGGMGGGGGGQSGPSAGTMSNMQMQQQTSDLQQQQRESMRNQRLAQLLRDLQNG